MTRRLVARLAKLETHVLPDDDPGKCWKLVVVHPDGRTEVVETICWSRTRGSWRKPVPEPTRPTGQGLPKALVNGWPR